MRDRIEIGVFASVGFVSAALLFYIQPLATRFLLPAFGGSAAVWNTALVFFQVTLLIGYTFAHVAARTRYLASRTTQLALMTTALITLPIGLPILTVGTPVLGAPVAAVVVGLAASVGAPYLALATVAPTLQRWFSRGSNALSANPYPLYAAGNAGSLLALVLYPAIIEPILPLGAQTSVFAYGYGALVGGMALASVFGGRNAGVPSTAEDRLASVPRSTQLRWLYLAFVPSLLLLAATRHLSMDIAAFPLLWIVPLTLYLLSFVVGFGSLAYRLERGAELALKLALIVAALTIGLGSGPLLLSVAAPLALLATAGFVAHSRLYRERPPPARLTDFYLLIAAGGALGGVVAALVAPLLFDSVLEYPIAIVLAATVVAVGLPRPSLRVRGLFWAVIAVAGMMSLDVSARSALLWLGVAGAAAFALAWRNAVLATVVLIIVLAPLAYPDGNVLASVRTFYGTTRVVARQGRHIMISGSTVHGSQEVVSGVLSLQPQGYYHEEGPLGAVMEVRLAGGRPINVGVIGLGAGAIAGYGNPGDKFIFYEIDPAVEAIATDRRLFSYLDATPAAASVRIGDGRVSLGQEPRTHDLLIVDAFSSDAIPTHLLTLEALDLYLSRTAPEGLILFHLSNRFMRLEPVVVRLAAERLLHSAHGTAGASGVVAGVAPSSWIAVSRSGEVISRLLDDPDWGTAPMPGPLWTDDFSNVLSVIRW